MVPVVIQTIVMNRGELPSILVLCPQSELEAPNHRIIPIWIGSYEAVQISAALENTTPDRPQTHDLFINTLDLMGAEIKNVVITAVDGQMFFAQIHLWLGMRQVLVDARPSDSIALALRCGAPILVEEDVLNHASYPFITGDTSFHTSDTLEEFHSFIQTIRPEDFKI